MSSEATQIELMIGWLSGLKDDHTPDGYPAVRMSTLTECEDMLRTQAARIASLESERDKLRAEVERLRKPLTPEAVWQLWAEVCKPERPTVDLVEAFARAIEAAKDAP